MTDLCDTNGNGFIRFATAIINRAEADHVKRRNGPTGRQLCEEHAEGYRLGHIKMASALYNKVRWSLEVRDRERAEAGI